MKSLAEIYRPYAKTPANPKGCDKGSMHTYIEVYEKLLAPFRDTDRAIVEIGVQFGDSLRMWREYFPNAKIYGVDINLVPEKIEGVTLIKTDSTHPYVINRMFKDDMFDVVIDDGSHLMQNQLLTACSFWSKLRPGGLHIIEDLETPRHVVAPGTFKMFWCFNAEMTQYDMRQVDTPMNDNAMVVLKKR